MKRLRHVVTILSLLVLCSLWTAPTWAADDAKTLVEKVFNKNAWQDMQGEISLRMVSKNGQSKQRMIKMWSKTNAQDETRMLMRFVKPADVKGTGFLTIEHQAGDDDRRMFLPALRRVNRISASGSGGNFMSSDFTYYDIGMPKLADWTYSFGADKTVQGVLCKTVIGRAANEQVRKDTGYSRVLWQIDPKRLISLGAEYFDPEDRPLKTLSVLKVQDINGTPFATHMKMVDANTGHYSEMIFAKLQTNTGLDEKIFTERNLRKWTR